MPNYLRSKQKGGLFFITLVAFRRRPLFENDYCCSVLRESIGDTKSKYPFEIEAFVLLPDHLHFILKLPANDHDFGLRIRLIKASFTRKVKKHFHREEWMNSSRTNRKESTIWQRRFWEHEIRDQEDFRKHFDYIHYNPVKHGLVDKAKEWEYSTFLRYVNKGFYDINWGNVDFNNNFGE